MENGHQLWHNHPKNNLDCKLGVHTASNQHNEKKYKFFWGYKNHIIVDCINGLPLCELTTTAEVADHAIALDLLDNTSNAVPVKECTLIADKGYDIKKIYITVKNTAVLSKALRIILLVLALIKIISMARKTETVQSLLPYLMTIVYLLIVLVFLSKDICYATVGSNQ